MLTEQDIIRAFEDVIDEASRNISASYDKKMANRKSKYYRRTGDVARALSRPMVSIRGDELKYELFDVNEIDPMPSDKRYLFNHHMNWDKKTIWNGVYVPEGVPEWLNSGFIIVYKGKRVKFKGLHYIEEGLGINSIKNRGVQKELEKRLAEKLMQILIQKGGIRR